MNHIIKGNKFVDLKPDSDFVNDLGIQKVVKMNNKMTKLFEENTISNKTIYYFSIKELFQTKDIDLMSKPVIDELNSKLDGDFKRFYNGVIRKFFPRISESNIKNFPRYKFIR